MERIKAAVQSELQKMLPGSQASCCGSFRRGKDSSGGLSQCDYSSSLIHGTDADILITHTQNYRLQGLLVKLVQRLAEIGLITDHLTMPTDDAPIVQGTVDSVQASTQFLALTECSCVQYMGVIKVDQIHRRIDIKVYSQKDYPVR